jgi:hypothetical protein
MHVARLSHCSKMTGRAQPQPLMNTVQAAGTVQKISRKELLVEKFGAMSALKAFCMSHEGLLFSTVILSHDPGDKVEEFARRKPCLSTGRNISLCPRSKNMLTVRLIWKVYTVVFESGSGVSESLVTHREILPRVFRA